MSMDQDTGGAVAPRERSSVHLHVFTFRQRKRGIMNTMRKWIRGSGTVAVVVALGLAAGGCVDRSVKGDEIVYGFSWWVPVITLLGALVLLPVGWLLRNKSSRFGWGMMLISPVLAIVVFPTTLTDKVRVDANHFESADGVWFMSTKHDVKFADLHELR